MGKQVADMENRVNLRTQIARNKETKNKVVIKSHYQKEVDILKSLDHPIIFKFIDIFDAVNPHKKIIVREYVENDLYGYIVRVGKVSDRISKNIFQQLNNVVHFAIRPQRYFQIIQ
jgi:serine/threonine protein kinase